jgi:hypothetical protein
MKGEKIVMKVQTGYLYHIKDDFFDIVNDDNLMQNYEKGKKRPTYFTIKDNDILWFIPISSKIDKYKKIIDKKIEKYGFCNTILIEKIFDEESAILLQNAFPTLEKYIDHVHTIDGKPARVPEKLEQIIYDNFKELMKLNTRGIKVFFTDIDKMKEQMLEELKGSSK